MSPEELRFLRDFLHVAGGDLLLQNVQQVADGDDFRSVLENRDVKLLLQFNEHLDKKLYMLSTGFRQRVTIARGFVNDHKIVFMDEPTSGLDVITARTIRQFLLDQAKERGRTIFIATHR